MTSVELSPQAETWAECLIEVVPVAMLDECYALAMREHRDKFPLTVSDLLLAHDKIVAAQPRESPCQFCEWYKNDPNLPECKLHSTANVMRDVRVK